MQQTLSQNEDWEQQNEEAPLKQSQSAVGQTSYMYLAMVVFVLIISSVLILIVLQQKSKLQKNGQFYQQELLSYQLIDFWKRTPQELQQEQKNTGEAIIDKGQHHISRQQLGHNAWQLLHMMTGSFPDDIPEALVKKFNIFLISFGQMYPCKLCANHFMKHLKEKGLFMGKTKVQLMTYLCQIHNMVNKDLGKPHHDCANVYEEWNTCGCSSQL